MDQLLQRMIIMMILILEEEVISDFFCQRCDKIISLFINFISGIG